MRQNMFYKSSLLRRILWAAGITVGALLLLILANYLAGIYFSRERQVPITEQPAVTTLNFELDPGISYKTAVSDNTLYFYSSENLKIIDSKGELAADLSLKLSRPAISVDSHYALFFDVGGKNAVAFNGSRQVSSLSLEENIILASINRSGYMLLITEGDLHNCAARVFTPDGEEIFKWNSGKLSVIAADIADNNKDITISAINTDEGKAKNQVIMFNIAKEKPFTNDTYEDDMYAVVRYSGGHLYCIGSNYTRIYNSYGKCVGNAVYDGRELQHYALDNDLLVLAFSGSSYGSAAEEIKTFNHKGEETGSFSTLQKFDFLVAKNDTIAINNGRTISILNHHCHEKRQINLSFDLRDFAFFGSNDRGIGITASGAELIRLN